MKLTAVVGFLAAVGVNAHAAEPEARQLFGAKATPAALAPAPFGSYAKGCLAGGRALPWNGPNHQVMRLSRNRYWGHPSLIEYLGKLADAAGREGWPGLLIGDLAQPRGGPMISGHASHQIGLDADIWLKPMPDHIMTDEERENVSAVSMLDKDLREIDREQWTDAQFRLIRRAALYPEVARIFVHPLIKRELCAAAGDDRDWLRNVRPWYAHHYHFHVRLSCPAGSEGCQNQAPPPPGDGCGDELASWLKKTEPRPEDKKKPPPKKKRELTMFDLPQACSVVLNAD